MAFKIDTNAYKTPFVAKPEQSTQQPQSPKEETTSSNSTTKTNQSSLQKPKGQINNNLRSPSNSAFNSVFADWLNKEFGLGVDLVDEDRLKGLMGNIDNPSDDFIAQLLYALKGGNL
ncbi:MAG: hypothetical protein J1E31_05170 [Helicobacter sp.]|nr:hypothetical protein [Helicobacter sp.]